MRVLVLGATGAIGRRVVPRLVACGHRVTGAGRPSARLAALERAGARAVAVDLLDPAQVYAALAGHDAVVNLATSIPSGARALLPGAWRATARLRREGSEILVAASLARGVGRLVQESFALAYPDAGDAWVDEETPIRPARYDRTVADAERAVGWFTHRGGVGVALRFAMLYGPGDSFTRDLVAGARWGVVPLPGARDAFAPFVTHDDAAAAVVAALGVPPGAYNVVDDRPVSRDELARILGHLLHRPAPRLLPEWMRWIAGSFVETIGRSLRVSNAKLKHASGWAPRAQSVREGLRAVLSARDASAERVAEARRHQEVAPRATTRHPSATPSSPPRG